MKPTSEIYHLSFLVFATPRTNKVLSQVSPKKKFKIKGPSQHFSTAFPQLLFIIMTNQRYLSFSKRKKILYRLSSMVLIKNNHHNTFTNLERADRKTNKQTRTENSNWKYDIASQQVSQKASVTSKYFFKHYAICTKQQHIKSFCLFVFCGGFSW